MAARDESRHAEIMLNRLASTCFRHRRLTVLIWLLAVIAISVGASTFGGSFASGGRLPGTDSDRAFELLSAASPHDAHIEGDAAQFVFTDTAGMNDPVVRAGVDQFFARVRQLPGTLSAPDSARELQVSADGSIATAGFSISKEAASADAIVAAAAGSNHSSTRVDLAGYRFESGGVPAQEGLGVLAAIVILLISFGSVVAMGLPIVTAIAGIVVGLAGVQLWAAVVQTPDFTVQVASMVGIGVGIDYALFIVTRYRTALVATDDPYAAMHEAINTAGRAVVFAGVTVMISLLGMLLMGMSFLNGLAFGTSMAVLVAVLAATTLLPAMLGFAGRHLDRFSIHRRAHRSSESGWHRWSRFVQRRALVCAIAGFGLLIVVAVPTLSMRLASADAGNSPAASTTRLAYDALARGFGPGYNGPLLVVGEVPADATGVTRLAASIGSTPGVASVAGVDTVADGSVAVITVIPSTGPQSAATAALVHRLRDQVIPASGVTAHVGGQTAGDVDFSQQMSSRLPIFIGAVLLLSFLLLLIVFRSLLVPLKAVLLNLLSIAAAYGVLVAVFQWGWLSTLIGVEKGAPIEPWAPMMLFAIVFGLSMDYEVFLLSSMKERVDRGEPNSHAVVEGLASTARVITAAAAIMVCVFGSFIFGDVRSIKLIGLGLAVAVLLDATVVRMVLVPATMELLGERNWWLPRRLSRVLPVVHVEGAPTPREQPRRELGDVH